MNHPSDPRSCQSQSPLAGCEKTLSSEEEIEQVPEAGFHTICRDRVVPDVSLCQGLVAWSIDVIPFPDFADKGSNLG